MTKIKTLVLDPPWEFAGGKSRSVNNHYPTVKHEDIPQLCKDAIQGYQLDDNMHCYLWCLNQHIDLGLNLMQELGFEYKTNIVWHKNSIGMGQYFRGQHEICLFGTKGKGFEVRTDKKNIPTIFNADKRKHSQKPEEFYELVESRSKGPYLELFSRHTRPGWIMWGNEVGKLDKN